jgi:hypothetical protein
MPDDRDRKLILIYDRLGSTRKNADLAATKYVANILSDNYPESISKILVRNEQRDEYETCFFF